MDNLIRNLILFEVIKVEKKIITIDFYIFKKLISKIRISSSGGTATLMEKSCPIVGIIPMGRICLDLNWDFVPFWLNFSFLKSKCAERELEWSERREMMWNQSFMIPFIIKTQISSSCSWMLICHWVSPLPFSLPALINQNFAKFQSEDWT